MIERSVRYTDLVDYRFVFARKFQVYILAKSFKLFKFNQNPKAMFNDPKGPIEHFSWAKFIVTGMEHSKSIDGKIGKGKDIRLVGGKVSKWKEREGHLLSKEMITGVFDEGVEVLIIGAGVDDRIECPDEVRRYIHSRGISNLEVVNTPSACMLYNRLFHQGTKVAMLAHGTC